MLQLFLEGFLKGREAMRSAVFFPLSISSKCRYESSPGPSLSPHEKVLAKYNSDKRKNVFTKWRFHVKL